jgi:hypothetical protein
VREVSDDEVWCEWLKTEYRERVNKKFHEACERFTTEPDYSKQEDNNQRKQLLLTIRGPMVTGIPKEATWYLVELDAEDYGNLYILGWWSFKILSGFTGRLSVASRNLVDDNYTLPDEIMQRVETSDIEHHRRKVDGILAKKAYAEDFKPLLMGRRIDKPPTILDGCHRSLALYVACFIRGERQYSPIQAYCAIIGKRRNYFTIQAIQPDTRLRRKTRSIQLEIYGHAEGIRIAKQMVKSKIEGQSTLLTRRGLPGLGTQYMVEVEEVPEDASGLARSSLLTIEEKYNRIYFKGFNTLIPEVYRPVKSDGPPIEGGVNNPFERALRILTSQAYWAITQARLEPYLGFLHSPRSGWVGWTNILSLVRDFSEMYGYVLDDYTIDFLCSLDDRKHVGEDGHAPVINRSNVYMSDADYESFNTHLAGLFGITADPYTGMFGLGTGNLGVQLRREAQLFAKYLRGERENWSPTPLLTI